MKHAEKVTKVRLIVTHSHWAVPGQILPLEDKGGAFPLCCYYMVLEFASFQLTTNCD